jgi:hypothetical protein
VLHFFFKRMRPNLSHVHLAFESILHVNATLNG